MTDISGTLSICRRAGRLVGGADEVKSSVSRREARLVLLSADLSENSAADIKRLCGRENIACLNIPMTMDGISEAVGKRWGIIAVTDAGFAKSLIRKLSDL